MPLEREKYVQGLCDEIMIHEGRRILNLSNKSLNCKDLSFVAKFLIGYNKEREEKDKISLLDLEDNFLDDDLESLIGLIVDAKF